MTIVFFFTERVEPRRRFVENEHLGFGDDDARNGDAPFLSARKFEGGFVLDLGVIQIDDLERLSDGRFHLLFLHVLGKVFQPEHDVLFHRFRKQLIFGILEHHAHFAAQFQKFALFVGEVVFPHFERAARQPYERVEVLHERGFSAARVPDDAEKFALLNGERNAAKRLTCKGRFGVIRICQILRNDSHISSATVSASNAVATGIPPADSFLAMAAARGSARL